MEKNIDAFWDNESKFGFKDKIETAQEELHQGFFEYFKERGYREIEPEPLLPRADKSLIFTNATIVPFKEYIERSNIPESGLMVEQKCLRFQNLKNIFNETYEPKYSNYFRMLGVMGINEQRCSLDAIGYVKNKLGIPEISLGIFASSNDRSIFKSWYQHFDVQENTENENFYNWKYGMENIRGRGITISVKQNSGKYDDIGNMVAILKHDEVIGYEFGFGIETTIARKYGLPHPLAASRISEVVDYKRDSLSEKFQDVIMQAVILYSQGIRPGEGGANYLAKKIIKAIVSLSERLGIDNATLYQYLSEYENIEIGLNLEVSLKVMEDVNKFQQMHNKNKNQYIDYVKNQIRLGNLDTFLVHEKGLSKYGLSEAEVSKIIGSLIK